MQINGLKLNSKRKTKKKIGRGGKKGTYSGKGNKGQKARSGAHVNPLFEGGRSTLIDHMKKKRGFKSPHPKKVTIRLNKLEKKVKDGDMMDEKKLIELGLVNKKDAKSGIKIIDAKGVKFTKKVEIDGKILVTASSRKKIEEAGGKVLAS